MYRTALILCALLATAACGGDPAPGISRLSAALEAETASYRKAHEPPPATPLPESEPDRTLARIVRESEAGRGFARFTTDGFRAAMDDLRAYVARNGWRPEDAVRIEDALADLLRGEPRPREAWWSTSLEQQEELRSRLAADPGDRDALEAFRVLRRHLDPDDPDLPGLRREIRERDGEALAPAGGMVLLAAERLPAVDEGRKRDLEAVILAVRVLEHRRETGEWPADLEAVRPETVPASPLGMRWELDTDPTTKKPAIFLRGGKRFGAAHGEPKGFHAVGPEESLFRFKE